VDDLVTGDRVVLRRFRSDDADDLVAACNDPMIQRFLSHLPHPYTYDDGLSWINHGSAKAFASGGAGYAIADPTTDQLLGGAGMGFTRSGAAEVGYWVAPAARGRGIATVAARMLSAHAFDRGFRRLTLRTAPENTNSQRVALAAGFAWESVQRGGHRTAEGVPTDMIVWSRLAEDPDAPTPRRLPDLPGYDGARASGKLTDGVVTLRPLIAADAEDTFLLRQVDDVVHTSVPPRRPEFDEILALCERSESHWLAGQRADFTIRDAESGGYAGDIMLLYNEPQLQQALIGYSIAPAWRRRGYATRAVRLVSEWTFAYTDVVRLFAGTAPDNVGSQAVLKAAGFVQEGLARKRLPGADGTRIDDIGHVLFAPGS
jgi:RimJ/RimL family protein N-acetyltransferase